MEPAEAQWFECREPSSSDPQGALSSRDILIELLHIKGRVMFLNRAVVALKISKALWLSGK